MLLKQWHEAGRFGANEVVAAGLATLITGFWLAVDGFRLNVVTGQCAVGRQTDELCFARFVLQDITACRVGRCNGVERDLVQHELFLGFGEHIRGTQIAGRVLVERSDLGDYLIVLHGEQQLRERHIVRHHRFIGRQG